MATPGLQYGSSRRPEEEDGPTHIGPFKKLESIGKGSFALVYRGVHTKRKTLVAIKSVQLFKLTKKLKENLVSEIKILRSLHHPHIVALIDCQEMKDHMHIVMEFCELGDLSAFIKKRNSLGDHPATMDMIRKYPNPRHGGLNEVIVRHFLKQIASALEFLRARNYIHRDLKPQNLLLNPSPLFYAKEKPEVMPFAADENSLVPAAGVESLPMLKVADFGFARFLPQTSLAETLCGSPLYMAPEILRYEKYDARADLWSVGTVLHEMMVSKPPFRASNHVDLARKIEKQEDKIKFPEDLPISRGMKNLIRGLLKRRPVERMTYEEFFAHPVVREDIPGLVGEDRPSEPEPEPEPAPEPRQLSRREQKMPAADVELREQQDRPKSDDTLGHSPREGASPRGTPPPRPTSRPSALAHHIGTPPRTSTFSRRLSNAAAETLGLGQREKRPPITSLASAPARQHAAPSTAQMERRSSRTSPSPGSSVLKERLDRERMPQRADERALKEARERAQQDITIEREYVLVEKRAVEVNALADELAASPQLQHQQRGTGDQGAMVRRATTQGSPTSTTGAHVTPSRAIQIATGRQRPEVLHHRTASYERRYGRFPNSVSSAISNALNAVAIRSGMGVSPPQGGKGLSPPKGYGAFPVYPSAAQSSILVVSDSGKSPEIKDEEVRTLTVVEDLAHRSNVVYGFAEVKYKQLLPAPPSDQGLGIGASGQENEEDEDLTLDAVLAISEEALVLYVKAVAILSKSIDIAGAWWARRNKVEDAAAARQANTAAAAARMTNVVQWVRSRFNECIDKAEFAARKLQEAQKQLPSEHRLHPNNRPTFSGSSTSIGSAENIFLPSGVTAEKLMYDRAIEMSKAAAVNELVGEDLAGCELNYLTAIHMLQAILDTDEETASRASLGVRRESRPDEELLNGLEAEDRQAINKLVESMRARLKTLRKKMEIQKAQKRASLSAAPPGYPSSRSSPSNSPAALGTPTR